ncbi:ATP-dependent DNA ligase [Microbacterium sp. KSW2-21]|uniref:ATP-dependent DNA ligase n=1 Tax=Microbacterium algihabitans TaxID=3075992 RepID=A0ABU3S001_9MICO|nr:ATP-dependent DNA ligase [Microbacterium sp. KSW2-21]
MIYSEHSSVDIEDRLLAHLRLVIMNKFRRGESFTMTIPHPNHGNLSLWLHPASPLLMQFYGGRQPTIDRALIEQLMAHASSPDGLTLDAIT